MKKLRYSLALVCIGLIVCMASHVGAFSITSQLTGDPRVSNPDNLIVDVTILSGEGGYASNQAFWTVDINSPLHPDIKLGGFFFNLADVIKDSVSFSGYDPTGWAVTTPATNAQGSGGADFQFVAADQPGQPNNDVTNSQLLTFLMTSSTDLTVNSFLDAVLASSDETVLGSGQLGAHLQSLSDSAGSGMENSGFAFGNYNGGETPAVPEPGTMVLLSTGLFGLAVFVKRRTDM